MIAGLYPTKVFLNRGNHETADMNKVRLPLSRLNSPLDH